MPEALPLGEPLDWTPARRPERIALSGSHARLRALRPDIDAEPLFALSHPPHGDASIWTYLPDGPYDSAERLARMLSWAQDSQDPLFCTICSAEGERPLGMAAYLRITPDFGVIEVGHIWLGPTLQRTTAATEAIYLLIAHAFDELGYRRVEWKCDALNARSRRAAERFGFTFEGVFRKHMVIKGRNRDTAWYAITDDQWPPIRRGFAQWLAPENFDDDRQRRSLGELIEETGRRLDPPAIAIEHDEEG